MKKVAILGATKGMGRSLARQLARAARSCFCSVATPRSSARSARDLEARAGRAAGIDRDRALRPRTARAVRRRARRGRGGARRARLAWWSPRASSRRKMQLEADAELTRRLLTVDFANTVVFCEEARRRLLGARRRDALRVQLRRGRARTQAGRALRRRQGGPLALPRGARSQVPGAGPAHDLREARVRPHRHDRGAEGAAVRRASPTRWRRRCFARWTEGVRSSTHPESGR